MVIRRSQPTPPRYLGEVATASGATTGLLGGELTMAARSGGSTVPAYGGVPMTVLAGQRCSVASAATLLIAAAVGGCGGAHKPSSQQPIAQQQVTQTVRSYLRAQTAGDGQAACALLSAGGQQQLITLVMRASKGLLKASPSCEDAVGTDPSNRGDEAARCARACPGRVCADHRRSSHRPGRRRYAISERTGIASEGRQSLEDCRRSRAWWLAASPP